ncbi:MAG: ABC transporter ATP-binding protein [Caenispirillum bisanense]|nr:ABC transporter ATP-binding protein [Caenispirillum bisanense]MCA1975029.1 ABC transporter ATP-binding protein [Caenispirillum sp.]
MTRDAIRLTGITKRYGAFTAVDDLTLAVPEGEFLALLGHNGAGKTTLMKMLLGLTRPTAGSLSVLGTEGGGAAARRALGFLPENVNFTGGSSGRAALRYFARLKGAPKAQAEDLLERVGLAAAAHKPVRTYSKGMRQRLGLAQALLGEPRLLLLDEPTSGLDPMLRQEFYRILRDMKAQGVTILLSSHVLSELQLRTDRIAIMRHGRLVACDTLQGLQQAAGLPVRIRVRVPEGGAQRAAEQAGPGARVLAANGRSVDLGVSLADKMEALRRLATGGTGAVEDLDVLPPSLEDVYAHFGGSPAPDEEVAP